MTRREDGVPNYGTVYPKGIRYYRARILDADGKQISLYGATCEELYAKELAARRQVEEIRLRRAHPTVEDCCARWLEMQSARVAPATLRGYTARINRHILPALGAKRVSEVTADEIQLALVPLARQSKGVYRSALMLLKQVLHWAEGDHLISADPCGGIVVRGAGTAKGRDPLTDHQVNMLLDAVRGLPAELFVLLGLYAGLRQSEILGLQWDCVCLDGPTPFLTVRRVWRTEQNRPVISRDLYPPAAKREIPIPVRLGRCLERARAFATAEIVMADRQGKPLSSSQARRLWQSAAEAAHRECASGVGLAIHVTPQRLRLTYLTRLLRAGVDPKTVQYLGGYQNSRPIMDLYAKVKYHRPEELCGIVNAAFRQTE